MAGMEFPNSSSAVPIGYLELAPVLGPTGFRFPIRVHGCGYEFPSSTLAKSGHHMDADFSIDQFHSNFVPGVDFLNRIILKTMCIWSP